MEKNIQQELNSLIEKGLLIRAQLLAEQQGLDDQSTELRQKAIWQMAAINRNMPGTKKLAQIFGLSKDEVMAILQEMLDSEKRGGENRALEPCYDQYTGQYLSFEQWLGELSKRWGKIGG